MQYPLYPGTVPRYAGTEWGVTAVSLLPSETHGEGKGDSASLETGFDPMLANHWRLTFTRVSFPDIVKAALHLAPPCVHGCGLKGVGL